MIKTRKKTLASGWVALALAVAYALLFVVAGLADRTRVTLLLAASIAHTGAWLVFVTAARYENDACRRISHMWSVVTGGIIGTVIGLGVVYMVAYHPYGGIDNLVGLIVVPIMAMPLINAPFLLALSRARARAFTSR